MCWSDALSQHISVKIAFLSRTERFGIFLFCPFYRQSRTTEGQKLAKWRCYFLVQSAKNRVGNPHKMAFHLMDMNIFFQKNMCLTDPNHYEDCKMMIFHICFNTEKNKNCFWWHATFNPRYIFMVCFICITCPPGGPSRPLYPNWPLSPLGPGSPGIPLGPGKPLAPWKKNIIP